MRTLITIGKDEWDKKLFVKAQLNFLCNDIRESEQEVTLFPVDGKLMELVKVLSFHKINYTTRVEPREEQTISLKFAGDL
jgi:hypothetical protein